MQEIAQQFRVELQELLDRYKISLSVPSIMSTAQGVFHKTLSFRYHPELHSKAVNYFLQSTGYTKPGDEPNAFSGPDAICTQGRDGCCATYKNDWDKCRGCSMYHGGK